MEENKTDGGVPEEKTQAEPEHEEPEAKSGEVCTKCQGTGLELPEGNIKFKSQAKKECDTCKGAGKIN